MGTVLRLEPNLPAATITEHDVSISRLASVLDQAVIEYEIDPDGDIYATDGLDFPAWIEIDEKRKLICFFTFVDPADEDRTAADWHKRSNEMNSQYLGVQFSWSDEHRRLRGLYWLSYDGGLNIRQFVKMLRRFVSSFSAALALEKPSPDT